jgi:ankyrin repeat protein
VRVGNLELVKLLVEEGNANINLNPENMEGAKEYYSVLQEACFMSSQNIVEYLVEKEADVNYKNKTGKTPLHRAVYKNRPDTVQFLIDCGADMDAVDDTQVFINFH